MPSRWQIDKFQPGLMSAVLDRVAGGKLIRKAGVMGVVLNGGKVSAGNAIGIDYPPTPHRAMEAV